MRIVIDLQGAQSIGSRSRGIGRYTLSLTQAIIRNCEHHEIFIALNSVFSETIEPIRSKFKKLLPQQNIRVWHPIHPVSEFDPKNMWRRKTSELIREAFLASLEPDIVYITSLFEGLSDDAVVSISKLSKSIPVAVTLFDLIPFIHQKIYLNNLQTRSWYLNKIDNLCCADILLSISESSRQEGIQYLNLPSDRIVNISTAADSHFHKINILEDEALQLAKKYELSSPFIMYTGGIDHRKNVEGLIRAFALIPQSIRRNYQLAIICSVTPESRQVIDNLVCEQGLSEREVILTGYVPEDDLIFLYNLCTLFVFPSWHEGFGLPALEAMKCGAPVIASNTSSLPEVIGLGEALFDPFDDSAIAAKMIQVLTDSNFRKRLIDHGQQQAEEFSWDKSAHTVISAFERLHTEKLNTISVDISSSSSRSKLAFLSPLPPERSGISDYSSELLPELFHYYDIEVIVDQSEMSDSWIKSNLRIRNVDWFINNISTYDRILYHFGNSRFHEYMFPLLEKIPGVVVLHDFYLSGIQAYRDFNGMMPGAWNQELYHSHGYDAVQAKFHTQDTGTIILRYPCNLSVLQKAVGIISHSKYSLQLAKEWYGHGLNDKHWELIPLLRIPCIEDKHLERRSEIRSKLGITADSFVVSCFGMLAPTKQNHRILNSWLSSSLSKDKHCKLVFVGENHDGDYGKELVKKIQETQPTQIYITGWVDRQTFQDYLVASDMAIQLRKSSRGETSAAILDCMNYGLPTIVNAHGSMAELPDDSVWKLPDEFQDDDLISALETFRHNPQQRQRIARYAQDVILNNHSPKKCASMYKQIIERFYQQGKTSRNALVNAVAKLRPFPSELELRNVATAIAQTLPDNPRVPQILFDISNVNDNCQITKNIIKKVISYSIDGYRIEPVYFKDDQTGYKYARKFTLNHFQCPQDLLADQPVESYSGDIFIGNFHLIYRQSNHLKKFHENGILTALFFDKSSLKSLQNEWLNNKIYFDALIASSSEVKNQIEDWISSQFFQNNYSFQVLCSDMSEVTDTKSLTEVKDIKRLLEIIIAMNLNKF